MSKLEFPESGCLYYVHVVMQIIGIILLCCGGIPVILILGPLSIIWGIRWWLATAAQDRKERDQLSNREDS